MNWDRSETSYHDFSQAFSDTSFHHLLPHNYSIGGGIYYSTTNYDFLPPSPPPPPLQDRNCFNIMITGGTNGDYQQQPPFPEFDSFSSCGYSYEFEPQPLNGAMKKSLSAQSIAARQRRRKISDKTQELGKLIPGGQKMNTADMFHAAYKYIKFLQAQLGILQFMDDQPLQENNETSELFLGLVTSTLVQEKLMCAEKCLVPHKLAESLSLSLSLSLHKNDDSHGKSDS